MGSVDLMGEWEARKVAEVRGELGRPEGQCDNGVGQGRGTRGGRAGESEWVCDNDTVVGIKGKEWNGMGWRMHQLCPDPVRWRLFPPSPIISLYLPSMPGGKNGRRQSQTPPP